MKLFRKKRKNNKGFSLVEVICAVAILGVTSTAIGSAMIVSTQNYQRGNAEVDVQKEAQATTNLVGNLLVDALNVTKSTETIGDQVAQVFVIKQEGKEYKLTYLDDKITYEEKNIGDGTTVEGCLAENVTNFDLIAATDFENSDRNVRVDLEVTVGEKAYEASFTNTARNGQGKNIGATQMARINLAESVVILEPGQTYDFNITVDGMTPAEAGIQWSDPAEYSADAKVGATSWDASSTLECHKLKVGSDAEGVLSFNISTSSVVDSDGNPLDTRQVLVYIRRVTGINLTDTIKDASGNVPMGNNQYKAGATYRIDAKAVGTSLEKALGLNNYDNDYVNPYWIEFDYSMVGGDKNTYMNVTANVQDTENPYFQFTLAQDMPSGSEIIITAKAKHPDGENKTGTDYGDVFVEYPIEYIYNPWSLGSAIVRGGDGTKVLVEDSFMTARIGEYGHDYAKLMRVYEVKYDQDGEEIWRSGCLMDVELYDDGTNTFIRPNESDRFEAGKSYVLEMRLEFYQSGVKVWPTDDTPKILHTFEYPMSCVKLTYECKQDGKGTDDNPIIMSTTDIKDFNTLFDGIRDTKLQTHLKFNVVKLNEGSEEDLGNKYTQNMQNKLRVDKPAKGRYRITAYLDDFEYKNASGVIVKENDFSLAGTDEEGVLYILVN